MRRPKVKLDHLIALMTVAARRNIDDAADELGLSASGVRVVRVERPLLSEIELPVAGNGGEERIQQVVAFLI